MFTFPRKIFLGRFGSNYGIVTGFAPIPPRPPFKLIILAAIAIKIIYDNNDNSGSGPPTSSTFF